MRRTGEDLLATARVTVEDLRRIWPDALGDVAPAIAEQLEIDARYSGYLERQEADIVAFRRDEALAIPADLDFAGLPGLSNELVEKFTAARPATLGAAARIAGVTPAALTVLLAHVKRRSRRPVRRQSA